MDNNFEAMAQRHGTPVHANVPSQARGHRGQDQPVAPDLNRLLIRHPDTCLLRISGHTAADQGVYDGDIVVIDRSARPRTTDLVVSGPITDFKLYRFTHHANYERPWGIVVAVIHPSSRLRD